MDENTAREKCGHQLRGCGGYTKTKQTFWREKGTQRRKSNIKKEAGCKKGEESATQWGSHYSPKANPIKRRAGCRTKKNHSDDTLSRLRETSSKSQKGVAKGRESVE